MTIEFLYENGKGSVVDEYGRPEPMYSIQWILLLMRSSFRLEILSSTAPLSESEWIIETVRVEKKVKPGSDVVMSETYMGRNYTRYSDQNQVKVL